MVFDNWLADWRENSVSSAASRRSNNCRRSLTMPSLAMRASAYWLAKWAKPRSANRPTMATGTSQIGRLPSVKPSSSSGFSSAGTEASVSALTRVPNTAMNQPSRYSLKYSHSRASRAFKGRCAAGETGGALGRGSVGVLGMAVRRFYEARGNSRARAAVKHTV